VKGSEGRRGTSFIKTDDYFGKVFSILCNLVWIFLYLSFKAIYAAISWRNPITD
jgi:hypothetical protein